MFWYEYGEVTFANDTEVPTLPTVNVQFGVVSVQVTVILFTPGDRETMGAAG
jgi:hypothetical protein